MTSIFGVERTDTQRHVSMLVWNTFQNDARVKNEADTLAEAGYKVTVHALHAPGSTRRQESLVSGVQVMRHGDTQGLRLLKPRKARAQHSRLKLLPLALSRFFTHTVMIWHIVRARPDVIHAHDVNMLPTAWLAARVSRIPLIYDAHEISTGREGYAALRGLVGWLEKRIMPQAAGTITTTDARAKFFARAYGISRPLVLQNRPRMIKPPVSDRLREELGLSQPWPIVIYQGGLQPGRGLAKLVSAAAGVTEAYFAFVGGGSQADELQQLTQELNLSARVKFISTVSLTELPSYTASANIGVQPIENTCLNHYTTDSNKLFEYVQAGLPVIASDLPEIRRVVREHDLGLLVPDGDIEALTSALRQLVSDPAKREYYSRQAANASSLLSWEAQEKALLALYERVLNA